MTAGQPEITAWWETVRAEALAGELAAFNRSMVEGSCATLQRDGDEQVIVISGGDEPIAGRPLQDFLLAIALRMPPPVGERIEFRERGADYSAFEFKRRRR